MMTSQPSDKTGFLMERYRWTFTALAIVATGLSGCKSMNLFRPPVPTAPTVFNSVPTADDLVAIIQTNTATIRQLNCGVKVTTDALPVAASGTLLMERPKNLRLKVGLLGMTDSGIDIGSNQQRFWVFNKSSFGGQTPTIYYANHAEYQNSPAQQVFQLQPQWLIDAMGLVELDPAQPIEGPYQQNGNLVISTTIPSPTGNMRRVLTLEPRTGVILQQAIYGPDNRLMVWARSSKHRYFPEHKANLPQHIALTMIAPDGGEMKLAIQILNHSINSLYVDPKVTWSMPAPADVPQIDLTRVNPADLQQITVAPRSAGRNDPDPRRRPFRFGRLKGFDLR